MATQQKASVNLPENYVPKRYSAWHVFKKNWTLLCLAIPALLYLLVFNYAPLVGIIIGFKNFKYNLGMFGSQWEGLNNFKFFFQSSDAWRVTRNALGYNAFFIVSGIVFSVLLALLLYELSNKILIRFYQTMMFIPHLLSWVVAAYILYAFLNVRSGMLNVWGTKYFGWNPVDWYNNPGPWVFIIPIASIWKGVGMNALIYYASLMGIDTEYFEAASIEGATRPQITRYITLPFLYPTITILSIMAVGKIFNSDFGLFYQLPMGSTMVLPTTDVIETFTFRALQSGSMGLSTAVGLVQSIVGLVLVLLTNWIVKKINPENALY